MKKNDFCAHDRPMGLDCFLQTHKTLLMRVPCQELNFDKQTYYAKSLTTLLLYKLKHPSPKRSGNNIPNLSSCKKVQSCRARSSYK